MTASQMTDLNKILKELVRYTQRMHWQNNRENLINVAIKTAEAQINQQQRERVESLESALRIANDHLATAFAEKEAEGE